MSAPPVPAAPRPAAPARARLLSLALLLGALLCVAVTLGLFRRAYPTLDVDLRMDRAAAIARARALAAHDGFAPADGKAEARAAALFDSDDSLATYVDFAAGGPDSLRALARGGDVALYRWEVRLYRPGDVHETRIAFAPDGRVVGLARAIPEAESRPTVSDTAGRLAADAALARWASQDPARVAADWRLVGRSTVTQPRSGRLDRTYRYERVGRKVGDAPIRADVTVTGPAPNALSAGGALALGAAPNDGAGPLPNAQIAGRYGAEPLAVRVYPDLPPAWGRRYGEMRSANDTFALAAYPGLTLFVLAAAGALVVYGRRGRVRWRPAAMVGGTVGVLSAAGAFNELPLAWSRYDTATAPGTFVGALALGALAAGVAAGLWVTLAVAAAEACARRAFPDHYDWFSYVRHAGAPPVARRILGGYALAAFGFAYVTVFYVVMRGRFGWWVPTGSLDDPNQIATPAPWVSAAAASLFAGTWEESIFRGVPLALLAVWARGRRRRAWWLAFGVLATALTFGFGHANYPSWPAYSRGVELLLEAVLWGVLALRVGLPTTIVGHALYDLVWFGLFALHGRGPAYRASAAAVLLLMALPALVVAVGWWRRRAALAAGAVEVPAPTFADVERALGADVLAMSSMAFAPATSAPGTPGRAGMIPSPDEESEPSPDTARTTAVTTADRRDGAPAATVRPDVRQAEVEYSGVRPVGARTRVAAALVVLVALLGALLAPAPAPWGPAFTASQAAVGREADSALRARGVDPATWDRTLAAGQLGHADVLRFLRESVGRTGAARIARQLGGSYLAPTLWEARYVHRHATRDVRREEWRVVVAPDGQVRTLVHDVADDAPGESPAPDQARAIAAAAVRTRGYDPSALREAEFSQRPRPHRLDSSIEYVDPAVALPGGATARVGVLLAGAEPVTVTRSVRLPESWQRADLDRTSRHALLAGLAAVGLFGLFLALVLRAVRTVAPRRPAAGTARDAAAIAAAGALFAVSSSLLGLPARLAAWDTATPWPSFLATLAIGFALLAALGGAVLAGMWALADALRRRADVPFLPDTAGGVRDGVLLGAALGTALPALAGLASLVRTSAGVPPAPSTAADALLPWVGAALGALASVLDGAPAAIPALAAAAGARSPRERLLALGAFALFAAGAAQAGADATVGGATLAAGAALGVAVVAGIVWLFGRTSALPWIAAGPAAAVVAGARAAVTAANPTDAAAGAARALAGVIAVALVWRWATRRVSDSAPAM